ncbi:hypothetical protein YSY22_33100 [Brevibacillus formosus]
MCAQKCSRYFLNLVGDFSAKMQTLIESSLKWFCWYDPCICFMSDPNMEDIDKEASQDASGIQKRGVYQF